MSKGDDTGSHVQTKLVELAMSLSEQKNLQDDMNEVAEALMRHRDDYAPTIERLMELSESMQDVPARFLESANAAFAGVKNTIAPLSSFLAFQQNTINTVCDTVINPHFFDSISSLSKEMKGASSSYLDAMKEIALWKEDYFSAFNIFSMRDTRELPVYIPTPSVNKDPPITNVHVKVHIEKMIVHRDGRPVVALPEDGCIELDPYLQLCMKDEEKKYGLYYYRNGKWFFEKLTPMQAKLINYLYRMGFRAGLSAQKLNTIADAFVSSKRSISNRIKEIEIMCDHISIQQLLEKVGEDKWCLSRQLGCFEGMWM